MRCLHDVHEMKAYKAACMSVCLSLCPHASSRGPLDVF
jgi:hypothetical protein